jgi:hypothetical protein
MVAEPVPDVVVPVSAPSSKVRGTVSVPVSVPPVGGVIVKVPTAFAPLRLLSGRLALNAALPVYMLVMVAVPVAVMAVLLKLPVPEILSVVLTLAAWAQGPTQSASAQQPIIAFIRFVSSSGIRPES